jgi:hypothetical protein
MQPYFAERDGNQNLPSNVAKLNQILARQAELIRAAKANGMTILTVEYKDCGRPTRSRTIRRRQSPGPRLYRMAIPIPRLEATETVD